jgi:hypothetical protein
MSLICPFQVSDSSAPLPVTGTGDSWPPDSFLDSIEREGFLVNAGG